MRLTDIMSGSGLAIYAEVALILFIVAFLVIVTWIFLPSRKRELDRASRIPLDDADRVPPPTKESAR
jgi:cbb3-type cytochrome oxidase subunit 3